MPAVACRAWTRGWSSPVPAARIWPPLRGSAWRRCLTHARRGADLPAGLLGGDRGGAFTAAWNDRFTAVGQWVRRADQADLARLHAPWDPLVGRYQAPDEKTIRVVLDRLDPPALTRALLGRPESRRGGGRSSASVRGYRAPAGPRQPKMLASDQLRAVAMDGETCRGARRADGTQVHLGAAMHCRFSDSTEPLTASVKDEPGGGRKTLRSRNLLSGDWLRAGTWPQTRSSG